MVIQITKKGAVFSGKKKELQNLKKEFHRNHCIVLPTFLEARLLKSVQNKLSEAKFYTNIHPASGIEACMQRNPILTLLQFLINDEKLFRLIEQITGCEKTDYFDGRIYSFIPGKGHHHAWHNDVGGNRLIAMSINLSTDIYSGGILKIRDSKSKKIYREITNTGFGDAVIFRVADHLEHQVTYTKGTIPKISFAGWFKAKVSYETFLKRKLLKLSSNGKPQDSNDKLFINLKSQLALNNETVERKLGDNTFVFINNIDKFCKLNLTGSYLLDKLKKNKSLLEIYKTMKKDFNVPASVLQKDLLNVLNQLSSIGLIKVIN